MRLGIALAAGAIAAAGLAAPGAVADKGHGKKGHGKKGTPGYVAPVKKQKTVRPPKAKAQTASADAMAGAFHMEFTARRAKGAKATEATGRFTGTLEGAGAQFAGPVTCLDVRGNDIGLFYPVTSTVPPGGEALHLGVFIYLRTDGQGHAVESGFMPVPYDHTDACDPVESAETTPTTGTATATGGKAS